MTGPHDHVKERDTVEIKCGRATAVARERLPFPGLIDTTTSAKRATDKTFLCMVFAALGPASGKKELEIFYASKNHDMIKKQKPEMSNALKEHFEITGDPIPFRKEGKFPIRI